MPQRTPRPNNIAATTFHQKEQLQIRHVPTMKIETEIITNLRSNQQPQTLNTQYGLVGYPREELDFTEHNNLALIDNNCNNNNNNMTTKQSKAHTKRRRISSPSMRVLKKRRMNDKRVSINNAINEDYQDQEMGDEETEIEM